jgi:hypothetical protein
VVSRYFGNSTKCLVDAMVEKFPCAEEASKSYVKDFLLAEDEE